jgi:hypothetical protein
MALAIAGAIANSVGAVAILRILGIVFCRRGFHSAAYRTSCADFGVER